MLLASACLLRAEDSSVYRDVNPDRLSGGLYAALVDAGLYGPRPEPARARATYANLAKGRPPAVLDPRVGVNVRLGDDPAALPANQRGQVEPHLVRSLANPQRLLATFQEGRFFDAGGISCGYAISEDGGFTWRRALTPNLTTVTGGRFNRATDAVAGAGPQGDLYLQALASAQGAFSLAAVVVSRSTDGGTTWSDPAVVFESSSTTIGPDKNWLAVNDHSGAPHAGRLVSTWTNFLRNASGTAIASPVVAAISDDRGATWSAPIEITPLSSNNQGTQPVFLPDGSLAVIYITFLDANDVTRFSIQCKRSEDGGRTFPANATTVVPLVNGWDDPQLRDGVFLPSCAASRQTGELFVAYTATVDGTPRVMVTRSSDQGSTWTTPVVASDQPAGISVMNPAIAASPDGRAVTVIFTDKRHAPAGRDFVDHYAALSFDGGASWQPNVRLTEMSSDIRLGPVTARGVMLADYLGVAGGVSEEHPTVAIWCETRTGDADPFAVRVASTPLADYNAWVTARRVRGSHLEDDDADGIPNYLEFVSGTDPKSGESGEDILVHRSSATSIDIIWPERMEVRGAFGAGGVVVATQDDYLTGRFSGAGVVGDSLPATALPALAPADGLRWRGARLTRPADSATRVVRGYRFSAGLPAMAASSVAAIDTDARLINLSTRGRLGGPAGEMIVGFVIDGNKSILVRAAGPALASLGVAGAVLNPHLVLSGLASDLERANDNWQQGGATAALFSQVGAFPFAPDSLDAALALDLGPQSYTAIASTPSGTAGVVLVEAYDVGSFAGGASGARLLNLSTRGEAGVGENALIAGFVLAGTEPRRVLIRAIGPGLAAFGVVDAVPDPILTLFRSGTEVARNDDWEISRSGAAVGATAERVGAFPLTRGSLDAALLLTLAPGAYTAVVSSLDGRTGRVLVEVYDAD